MKKSVLSAILLFVIAIVMIIAITFPDGSIDLTPQFIGAQPRMACDGASMVILSAEYSPDIQEARLALRNGAVPLEYGVLAVQEDETVTVLSQKIIAGEDGELSVIVENIPPGTAELVVRSATCPAAQDLTKLT